MLENLKRSLESLLGLSKPELRGVFVLLLILLVVLTVKIRYLEYGKSKTKEIEIIEKQIDKHKKDLGQET